MKFVQFILFIILMSALYQSHAQQPVNWNGKKCAVVLTYDDALNVHLDNVIPCLDSAGFKGTFYIIGELPILRNRMSDWRKAANNGHELGNHSLTHPCDSRPEGRSWVSPEADLSKYSALRAVNEIMIANTLLQAIDGKTERTFAYPCGDTEIDSVNFYDPLESVFPGARGVRSGMQSLNEVDLNNINSYFINGHSSSYMIDLVKKAMETNTLLVFMFHGVGGEHNIDVSTSAHSQLIQFLKQNKNEIWVAPMLDVAKYIKENQTLNK